MHINFTFQTFIFSIHPISQEQFIELWKSFFSLFREQDPTQEQTLYQSIAKCGTLLLQIGDVAKEGPVSVFMPSDGQETNTDQTGVDGLPAMSELSLAPTATTTQSSVVTDNSAAGKSTSTPTIGLTPTSDNYVFIPQHVIDSNPSSLSSSSTSSSCLTIQQQSSTTTSTDYLNVKQQTLPTKTPVNTPTGDIMMMNTGTTTPVINNSTTTNTIEAAIDFMIADQQQQQQQRANTSTPIKIRGGESHQQRAPVSSVSCNDFTTATTSSSQPAISKSQSEDNIIIQQQHTEQSRYPTVLEHPASPIGELDRDWRIRYRQFLACMMSEPVLIEYFENAFDMMNAIERYKVEFEFKQIQSP